MVGVPGRVVAERDPTTGERRRVADDTRQVSLPDPELEVIRCLHAKVAELEERIALIETGQRTVARANGHNGAARPCNEEIERALQASLRAFEGKD